MYLLDIKRLRAFSIEDSAWLQRISVIFAFSGREKILDGSLVEIPPDDLKQYDVTLKEPIELDDLAKALESLADSLRKSSNIEKARENEA